MLHIVPSSAAFRDLTFFDLQHETRCHRRARVSSNRDAVLPSEMADAKSVTLSKQNSIPIHERVELPESWIPADSRVEIDAKITAGMIDPPSPSFLACSCSVSRL